jgi:hypothetical protein
MSLEKKTEVASKLKIAHVPKFRWVTKLLFCFTQNELINICKVLFLEHLWQKKWR